jgi:hypothetical protein
VRCLAWLSVIIVGLGVMVVLPLLTLGIQRGIRCGDRVVSVNGPSGQRLECVCLEDGLSTCLPACDEHHAVPDDDLGEPGRVLP